MTRPGYDHDERQRDFDARWKRAEKRGQRIRAVVLVIFALTIAAMIGVVWFAATTPPEAIGRYVGRLMAGAQEGGR